MLNFNPAIEVLPRRDPGTASKGDSARATIEPSWLHSIAQLAGPAFGIDLSVPLLASLSACNAILTKEWRISSFSIEWLDSLSTGSDISSVCRLTSLKEAEVIFAVDGPGYRGTLQFASVSCKPERKSNPVPTPLFDLEHAPPSIALGATETVSLNFKASARVEILLPYGHGIRVPDVSFKVEVGQYSLALRADRPHEVNLGKPWIVSIRASCGSTQQTLDLPIKVTDPEPGRILYILTEDCETFDGGPQTGAYGSSEVLGNHNNFMDPEDYLVQMVSKPNRMNEIADRHGARWTHFWAAHQRFAAEWACAQSSTGKWQEVLEALDTSVRAGSFCHEYAPHLHCDYEPDSALPPQPRLVYDSSTDGILPNDYYDPVTNPTHRYHDWDGAARGGRGMKQLGQWNQIDTKTGSLFEALHYLSSLQVPNRLTLCARTGSFDFGSTHGDQNISTQAYEQLGLRGNSDARFKGGDPIPGGHLFWCKRDDRFQFITDLSEASLVQLAVTSEIGFSSLLEVNGWFEKHWPTCRGAGVHALSIMTHAMFMSGQPDVFRSTDGGSFDVLDQHLTWVRDRYPSVEFATASEAIMEFLDYYTPTLLAIVEPRLLGGDPENGYFIFGVRLLGRGIHVDPEHPMLLSITAPFCFVPSEIGRLEVKAGKHTIASSEDGHCDITLKTRDIPLTVHIEVKMPVNQKVAGFTRFEDTEETKQRDLLNVQLPVGNYYPSDFLRLLTNPIAGSQDSSLPRLYWRAILLFGASIQQSMEQAEGQRPVKAHTAFETSEDNEEDFTVSATRHSSSVEASATDTRGQLLVTSKVSFDGDTPSTPSSRWSVPLRRLKQTLGNIRQ